MPSAIYHEGSIIQKHLYIGDSGTGKTTSLLSLVKAGKHLRIWDFDNLLDGLIAKCKEECPERLDQIEYIPFRDKFRATASGPIVDGQPQAYINSLRALNEWEDGTNPSKWGPDYVAVIDSHTLQARAAELWARGMQGAAGLPIGVHAKGVEPRNIIYTAQQSILQYVSMLTSDSFRTNVIFICHVKYLEHDGMTKGFPLSTGTAISTELCSYFPSVTLATKKGAERIIRTRSTNLFDLKNPKSFSKAFADELPMETGWATLFEG